SSYMLPVSKAITVSYTDPAPVIMVQPGNAESGEGKNVTFNITVDQASAYRWQVKKDAGFTDIVNGNIYDGAATPTLTVTNVPESMDGYVYRCIASGDDCSPDVISNEAMLTIKLGDPQSITFAATAGKVYGSADFDPG